MLTQLLPGFCVGRGEGKAGDDDVGEAIVAATSVAEMFELLLAAPLRRMAEEGVESKEGKGKGGRSSAEIKEDEHSRKQQPPLHHPCVIVLDAVIFSPSPSLASALCFLSIFAS